MVELSKCLNLCHLCTCMRVLCRHRGLLRVLKQYRMHISTITLLFILRNLLFTIQRRQSCLLLFYPGVSSARMALVKAAQRGRKRRWKREKAPGVFAVRHTSLSLQKCLYLHLNGWCVSQNSSGSMSVRPLALPC